MEELFQLVFEIVFQVLFEFLADVVWRAFPPAGKAVLKAVFCVAFAGLLGFLSTLVLPEPIIRSELLRIAYLVVAPFILAASMAWIGHALAARQKKRSSLEPSAMAGSSHSSLP